jgi:hypothetical protein
MHLARRMLSTVALTLTALSISVAIPLVAHSSQSRKVGQHRIGGSPTKAAFVFGFKPGFNPRPAGQTTIYGDGTVAIKSSAGSTSQGTRLTKNGLSGLLKLAEAEGFFSLPTRIVPKVPVTDSTDAFITIHTTTQDKTVAKDVTAHNDSFTQLFAVLSVVAGSAH